MVSRTAQRSLYALCSLFLLAINKDSSYSQPLQEPKKEEIPQKDVFLNNLEKDFSDGSLDSLSYSQFFLLSEAVETKDPQFLSTARERYTAIGHLERNERGQSAIGESFLTFNVIFGFGNCESKAKLELSKAMDYGTPKELGETDGEPYVQFLNRRIKGKLAPHVRIVYKQHNGYTSFEEKVVKIRQTIIAPKEVFVAGYLKHNNRSYQDHFNRYFTGIHGLHGEGKRRFLWYATNSLFTLPLAYGTYEETQEENSMGDKPETKLSAHDLVIRALNKDRLEDRVSLLSQAEQLPQRTQSDRLLARYISQQRETLDHFSLQKTKKY